MKNGDNLSETDPPGDRNGICSIGYSVHEMGYFLQLLRRAGVTVLADVRSHPSSRFVPAYNQPELKTALRTVGIAYEFLGEELGGRPRPPELYDSSGRVNYLRVRAESFFRHGLNRLCQLAESNCVAMMCGEEDPLDCHRGLMITPALLEGGVAALHLRGDGTTETTAAFEERLLRETRLESPLFGADPDERRHLLKVAYRVMADRKAFRIPSLDGYGEVEDNPD